MIQTFASHFIFCTTHSHYLICPTAWCRQGEHFSPLQQRNQRLGLSNSGHIAGSRAVDFKPVSSRPASCSLALVTVFFSDLLSVRTTCLQSWIIYLFTQKYKNYLLQRVCHILSSRHWSPDSQVADKAHVSFYLQNELITKMGLPFWGSFIMQGILGVLFGSLCSWPSYLCMQLVLPKGYQIHVSFSWLTSFVPNKSSAEYNSSKIVEYTCIFFFGISLVASEILYT